MYWASLSEENSTEYSQVALSEMAKMIRHNLKNKRARLREISSGRDVTAEFLPELERRVAKKKTIEQIAKESGLSKVYDIVYRYDSLEVHGNTFGLSDLKPEMDGIAVAVSAINAFLRVILLVADNKDRSLTADEVLSALNMRSVPAT
jgi:DNA-binding phage protein